MGLLNDENIKDIGNWAVKAASEYYRDKYESFRKNGPHPEVAGGKTDWPFKDPFPYDLRWSGDDRDVEPGDRSEPKQD